MVIAGRPNVGKSTLVNRIVGDVPPSSRSARGLPAIARNSTPNGADGPSPWWTPGDGRPAGNPLDAQVSAEAERAIAEADLVRLVVDVTVGVIDEDLAVARVLKRSGRPVRVVVNKVDSSQREADAWDAMALGLGEPWPISALHGRGTGDLLDYVVRRSFRQSPSATGDSGRVGGAGATASPACKGTMCQGGSGGQAQRRESTLSNHGRRPPFDHPRRAGHHTRRGGHGSGDTGWNDLFRGHRRHAPEEPDRAGDRVLLGGPGTGGPRRCGHRPIWPSMPLPG